jgi:hypothetical protein
MILEFLIGLLFGLILLTALYAFMCSWDELESIEVFETDSEFEILCNDMSKGHHRYGRS